MPPIWRSCDARCAQEEVSAALVQHLRMKRMLSKKSLFFPTTSEAARGGSHDGLWDSTERLDTKSSKVGSSTNCPEQLSNTKRTT